MPRTDTNTRLAHVLRAIARGRATLVLQSILGWFAAPDVSQPDLSRRSRVLWMTSWLFFAVVMLGLGIAVLVEPETLARRAVTVLAVGGLVATLHTINRAGRPALASWILVIGLCAIVTQRAWITGGIHAPVAVFYVIFIVMATVLLGARGGLWTAAACFLGAVVLTVGTTFVWLTPRPGAGSPLEALVFVVLAIGLALVLQAMMTPRARGDRLAMEAVQMFVHDMRTPMQIVLGHLQLLKQAIHGDAVTDIEAAIDGATSLHRMTTSLLDLSRLEAGRMPVRRSITDVGVLADSVVSSIRVLQPTRDIAVEVHGDAVCTCDPEITRRVVENLVSNAIKHTDVDTSVRVVVSGLQDMVRIAVHDEGPGVPPQKRTLIFEPYSAEGLRSATGYESSGLGLAFCRLAVEAQRGSIRVEDGVPRGTVFVVELPR